ncbi:hypothetical protein EMCG_07605 [[Emmonsia] crescens]|uniref:ER membrane protein complex subunit 10 n=1 Tax=[Emmonsia] crescens TaxID=73230 RepID=A0A0G2JB20_9EURO|nr:hypothetical protein EMCG_07605 [Emmonsia crescens UAMH 3008]
MRLLPLYLLSLSLSLSDLTSASASASAAPLSADIFYWPLSSSSKPSPLARIFYDPSTLQSTVDSYTPPQPINDNSNIDKQADLLRIGLYTTTAAAAAANANDNDNDNSNNNPEKQWVGILSSLSLFANNPQTLTLHLDQNNHVYHAAISCSASSSAAPSSDSSAQKKSTENNTPSSQQGKYEGAASLKVEFVRSNPSPSPHLNRPIVLNPDGNAPEEVVEKSLLQRYWWVLGIIAILAFTGSADGS